MQSSHSGSGDEVVILPTLNGPLITARSPQPLVLPKIVSSHPSALTVMVVGLAMILFPNVSRAETFTAESVLSATNVVRQHAGVGALTYNGQLATAAELKAHDMFAQQYFSHTSPTGQQPWHWFATAGYAYTTAGENLAIDYLNATAVVQSWMKSSTHRENILNPHFRDAGIAVVEDVMDGQITTLVVEFFGSQTVGLNLAPTIQSTDSTVPTAPPAPQIHPARQLGNPPADSSILPAPTAPTLPTPVVLGASDHSAPVEMTPIQSPFVTTTIQAPAQPFDPASSPISSLPWVIVSAILAQLGVLAAAALLPKAGDLTYPQLGQVSA